VALDEGGKGLCALGFVDMVLHGLRVLQGDSVFSAKHHGVHRIKSACQAIFGTR
jgi:hypothetical protein